MIITMDASAQYFDAGLRAPGKLAWPWAVSMRSTTPTAETPGSSTVKG
jgi:hypothetical protein